MTITHSPIRSITMTDSQTRIYDADDAEARELMRELRRQAGAIREQTGQRSVEIYTADGVVADVVQ